MIDVHREPMRTKTIEVYYDFGVSCYVDTEDMVKAGIAVLQLVSNIERLGYRVKLTVGSIEINIYTINH